MVASKELCLFVSMILLAGTVSAAKISGTAYEWYTLEPLGDVILSINTKPPQRFVAKEGVYEFSLGEGDYTIEASYYEDNLLKYYAVENVSIESDGEYVIDLLMFPSLDPEEKLFNDSDINFTVGLEEPQGIAAANPTPILLIVIVIIALVLYFFYKKSTPPKKVEASSTLPDDLQEIIDLLERNDGRMTQLELRKELNYSEAKVSLMLLDLENRGLIEKFKRGRGNVVILKK